MSRRRSRRNRPEAEEEEDPFEEEEEQQEEEDEQPAARKKKRKPRAPRKKALPSRSRRKRGRPAQSDEEEEDNDADGGGDGRPAPEEPGDKGQKVFLQTFLGQPSVRESQCAEIAAKLNVSYGGQRTVSEYVSACNESMRKDGLFLSLKRGVDEASGVVYYVLCNTKEDAVVKTAALGLSLPELGFVERMIELIVKGKGLVPRSALVAARSAGAGKSTSQRRAEEIVDLLEEQKYLVELDKGRFGFGIRGCVELVSYVQKYLPDYDIKCHGCKMNVFWGLRCPKRGCRCKFHKHCGDRWFAEREATCPECQTPLTDDVNEDDEDEEEEEEQQAGKVDEDDIELFV